MEKGPHLVVFLFFTWMWALWYESNVRKIELILLVLIIELWYLCINELHILNLLLLKRPFDLIFRTNVTDTVLRWTLGLAA